MDAGDSLYDEEESKFQDYNYDDDFQEVQNRYNNDSDDGSSVSTYKKKQKKMLKQLNSLDKDHRVLSITVNYKKKDIEVYATNDYPGTIIKDAVTGTRVKPYRVGTADEHLFFKTKLLMNGCSKTASDIFFFDSPEQYERHMHVTVPQSIKEKWTNKFVEIKERQKAV